VNDGVDEKNVHGDGPTYSCVLSGFEFDGIGALTRAGIDLRKYTVSCWRFWRNAFCSKD
jgi:hypothetical protein